MIKEHIESLKSINKKGEDYYNFLLSKSENHRVSNIDTDGIKKEFNIIRRPKACFYNAQQLTVFSEGKYKYYEGYGVSRKIGIPFEHAWNVLNDEIVDISWEDGVEYLGVEIPYNWIKKKFYEFAFKHNISDSHLIRYYEEVNKLEI